MAIVLLLLWSICGFLAATIASEKGYSYLTWFIAGLLFSLFALVAAAGLPDKKLRKFIRLIGEKQNAIDIERETIKFINGFTTLKFEMPKDSKKEEIYERLENLINKKGGKRIFDSLEIKSYGFEDSQSGRKQFVVRGEQDKYLIILSGVEKDGYIQWKGKI
tara:strand:+ start:32 stop:517 length:486 start_codon:yes stop_codon:yes gene_type:complete